MISLFNFAAMWCGRIIARDIVLQGSQREKMIISNYAIGAASNYSTRRRKNNLFQKQANKAPVKTNVTRMKQVSEALLMHST